MPFIIRKNKNESTYKVTNKETGKVYAYKTQDPKQLIQAIEYNKHKTQGKEKKALDKKPARKK